MQALKNHLRTKPVTDAIYEAGYGSCSRVYERTDTHLGMTPAEYGAGGAGAHITYATTRSPLGRMLLAATDRGLCAVQFADTDALLIQQLRREYPAATVRPMSRSSEEFLQWIGALNDHLRGAMPHADLPLDVRATAFQVKVWNYLRQIPRGETQSYAEVAAAIGHPTAARAVARACASNKVAIVIPCHRVIRGTGHLGGYRWGLDRKASLLAAERVE